MIIDPVRLEDRLEESLAHIRSLVRLKPRIALILGSGLGQFAEELTNKRVIPSADIPFYPRSTVPGHAGRLVFGKIASGRSSSPPLLVFQGRVHYYESSDLQEVIYPVLVARKLGASVLLVTNAAGGLQHSFKPGDLMVLRDFLSFSLLPVPAPPASSSPAKKSPLRLSLPSRAPRIPAASMDVLLNEQIQKGARSIGVKLKEGTYCWLQGPSYETAAEIEMLRRLGVDAVGMSTVPEIVTALRLGMRVAGISLISNLATGLNPERLSHEEVTLAAEQAKPTFTKLLKKILLTLK